MNPVAVAILAGGQSHRMGRDKAGLIWQDETLLARTARVAVEAGCPVLVVGRERPVGWAGKSVRFVSDAFPGQGPLGGLATALQALPDRLLLLACDMPLLSAAAIRWLTAQEPGKHGIAVHNGTQREPLFSIYTPEVRPLVDERFMAGKRSLQSLIDAGEFREITAPPEVAAVLVSINTPDEWARIAP